MRTVAVFPGKPDTIHLRDTPVPSLDSIENGRGVLIRMIAVGVDGTDKEINAAEYGKAPEGEDFLVIGHESLGVVEEVGPGVTEYLPGDTVTATVRRPGSSIYDRIGRQDVTLDDEYYERGINLRHGFLSEYIVDTPGNLIRVPRGLGVAGVLTEPMSVAQKGIAQAYEAQRRLGIWQPKRAAVLGAGTLGLLTALALRIRGLEVDLFGRRAKPYQNAGLAEELGARYVNLVENAISESGPYDLIFEGTGYSPLVFDGMGALGKNGVIVLASVTGGKRVVEVPADKLNLDFVLGNKLAVGTVNAARENFEQGVKDLSFAELAWPGWLGRLLTHRVSGLESYREMMRLLTEEKNAIKVYLQISEFPQ